MEMDNQLLTPERVSELLGVPVATLAQWRYRKQVLPYLHLGRLVRYDPTDVEAYLQCCRIEVRGQNATKRGAHVRVS